MPTPLLSTIQAAVAGRLESVDYLIGIPVVTESKGDIVTMVQAALNKVGIGILVMTPAAFASVENVPGPYFYGDAGGIKLRIQVYEHVTINQGQGGSQKPAATVAENILAYLHLWAWNGGSEPKSLITIDPGAPTMVCDFVDGILIYDVNLATHGGLAIE